ncbi:hypothetical protein ASD50_06095 [Mesorhizobium sp. Root552]|uniref:DUF4169 family protein n=1 Tax=Mesorhizobium sp. Root552 TaxID=1736555 RepID=UPI0006FD8B09|nr:DUF4169 family protein [Mesorhizobium sp. Root552]KQZ19081.1 hypothetical protein ASD50_06095 [Mesorhizobium sp. Root552]
MAEIVNLRQARKHKARSEKERIAAENRAIHGRSKAEREREGLLERKATTFLDAHRRSPGHEPGDQ